MDQNQRFAKFLRYLFYSFLFHFVLVVLVLVANIPKIENKNIEVTFIERPKFNSHDEAQGQVVEQDEKPINNELDKNAKFLSAHNQKVEKQTVAKNHGEFRNRASRSNIPGKGGQPKKVDMQNFSPKFDVTKSVQDRQEKERQFDEDSKILVKKQSPQQQVPSPADKQGPGGEEVSQKIDYIKDLDPGLETLLSSKEFIYYTYYARMRRQLNQFWSSKVREKVSQLYKQGRQIASSDDRITKCLITLNKDGKLEKIQIIGISGVRELDEAAVEAFKAAAPFPNPPNGMIDPDGKIKIRWDFILEG